MSATLARNNAILRFAPSADQRERDGYLVDIAGNTATVSASATVPAKGLILDGDREGGASSIMILGPAAGTVRVRLSGAVTKGDRLQQAADGTLVADAGSGARVVAGVAMEDGGAGWLIEAVMHMPIPLG